MDNLLKDGDMVLKQNGDIAIVTDTDEIIQRIMIALAVKKGNFPLNVDLGSELYTLNINTVDDFTLLSVISEALENITGVTVTGLEKNLNYDNQLINITLYLSINGEEIELNIDDTIVEE